MATDLGQLAEELGLSARAGPDLAVGDHGGNSGAAVQLVIAAEAVGDAVTVPLVRDAVPVGAQVVRVLAVALALVFPAFAVLDVVADVGFLNADVVLAVEAGGALSASNLVISFRAITETVTAEPVVDAATAVAFVVPFAAVRGACSRAVDLVFPTRTVIERVTDKVFRDADVGACTVEISPTALGTVNFFLAS